MFMGFVVLMFVILLLVSLDGQWGGTQGILRRAARRAIGLTALLLGIALSAGLIHGLVPQGTVRAGTDLCSIVLGDQRLRAAETQPTSVRPAEQEQLAEPEQQGLEELEPLPHVEIPYESRPEWVEAEADLTQDVHRVPISAGPYERKSDCQRALDREKLKAVAKYVDEYLGSDRASDFIRFDVQTIDRRLIREGHTHDELIQVSLGPMHQVHALLEFDPEFRQELDASWRDVQAGIRLAQTGLGAFGVLALLAVVFGYFKLDTATRGYYSFKLQILATLAILALIATGVLVAGWIPRL